MNITSKAILGWSLILGMGFLVFVALSGMGFMIAAIFKYLSWYHIVSGTLLGSVMVILHLLED